MNYLKAAYSLFIERTPILLYHKPTLACNCRCSTCDTWKLKDESVLPFNTLKVLLTQAAQAGIQNYTAWGGEPLLSKDLGKILELTKSLGMNNSICTNAYLLEERAPEIGPNLDLALVSIDGIEEDHDAIRGVKGLFQRAIKGIVRLKSSPKVRINIWTTLNSKSKTNLRQILNIATDLNVVVEFFPIAPIQGYNDNEVLSSEELIQSFRELKSLKKEGLPVGNTNYYLDLAIEGRAFRCNFPLISIFLNPDGTLYTCEEGGARIIKEWGNWQDTDLKTLFKSKSFKCNITDMSRCNRCFLPCVGETSGFLPLQILRKKLSIIELEHKLKK